jgi:GNAT superfamily N-acetyltransferase
MLSLHRIRGGELTGVQAPRRATQGGWSREELGTVMGDEPRSDRHELKDGAQIEVRRATLEDVRAIHAHFLELGVIARGLRFGGNARAKNRGYVKSMVEHWDVLIALDLQGNVIGEALYVPDPFDDPEFRDWATIEMSVAERWRRRGVGTVLLRVLKDHAGAAGIGRFVIDTHRSNRPVINWAETQGAEQYDDPEANWHQFVKDI